MKKIGIIGVESKHADFFGSLFNIEARFDGYRVNALWGGDAPERMPSLAEKLGTEICDTMEELIDITDAVMIIHRRGSEHYRAAMLAINAHKPVFIDKPFVSDAAEAIELTELCAKTGAPVFGGTTLKFLPEITKIKDLIDRENPDTIIICYPADPQSIYDGFWYYGSHLSELCVTLCGTEYSGVKAVRNKDGVLASVVFPHVKAVINSSPVNSGLHITLMGHSVHHYEIDETDCYYYGMAGFVGMLDTNRPPIDFRHIIASTKLLADIIQQYNK